ncbi:MAG: hypothetical protein Q9181_007202 [Wetmoreana brouardii]
MREVMPATPQSHRTLAENALTQATSSLSLSGNNGPSPWHEVTNLIPPKAQDDASSVASSQRMTKEECSIELKKTKKEYKDLQARYTTLDAVKNQYLQGQNHLLQQASEKDRRCQEMDFQLNHLKTEIHGCKQRGRALEQELAALQQELAKAKTTIHIQSQAIQRGRDSGPFRTATNQATPHRGPANAGDRFVENYGFGYKSVQPPRPDPRESLYAPSHYLDKGPSVAAGHGSQRVPNSAAPAGALVLLTHGRQQEFAWATEFSALCSKLEDFCRVYFNRPDNDADQYWPVTLGDKIVQESSPNHVVSLASDHSTRYHLLTRIILSLIEWHFFHSKIIKGFSEAYDYKILNLRRQVVENSPMHVVRRQAQAEVDTIKDMIVQPGFQLWKTRQIQNGVNDIMSRLRPAIAPGFQPTLLGNTFATILDDAWRIGIAIATSTSTFDFRFPAFYSHFDPTCMLNRDPYIRGNPNQLQARGARVALGITPYISMTDIMTDSADNVHGVHMANVLLRL